jgi:hypothetical protein
LQVKINATDGGGIIAEDLSDLDIEFDTKPECAKSSKWLLVESFTLRTVSWISIGSIEDVTASFARVVDGFFPIKKQGLGYKLVYFSKGSGYNDIQSFNDATRRRLVTKPNAYQPKNYHPFEVKFVNANRIGRSVD